MLRSVETQLRGINEEKQSLIRRFEVMKAVCRFFKTASGWTVGAMALGLLLSAAPMQAQTGTVEGTITAAGNGRAVAGAQVTVVGTNLGTTSGRDGR